MSVLLVDAGNTRIKWAVLRADKLSRQKAVEHAGISARQLERQLFATRGLTRVIAASVAGTRINRMLAAACRRKTGLVCEFVASARNAGRAHHPLHPAMATGRGSLHGGDCRLSSGPLARAPA